MGNFIEKHSRGYIIEDLIAVLFVLEKMDVKSPLEGAPFFAPYIPPPP